MGSKWRHISTTQGEWTCK